MSDYCTTVIFSDKAYNAIIDETFRKDPIETGGILLGHVLDNGLWVVMEVIPPGIDSVHQYAYFEYDKEFVNYLAESVATKYEHKLELLGLWHRHPGSMDTFSGTDDGTNSVFASLRPCGAISGLVNVDPNFRLTMRHVSYPLHYEIVEVEVGDDLIPEDYFKLRHYPTKGLNPALPSEKKNELQNIASLSEQESSSTKNIQPKETAKRNNVNLLKCVTLTLLSIFFLIFFGVTQISQNIAGESKQETLYEILYTSSDSIGLCIKEPKATETTEKIVEKKDNEEITREKEITTIEPGKYIKHKDAIDIVKFSFLTIGLFLIGFIFMPLCEKKYLYSIGISTGLSILALVVSPINISIAFVTFTILLTIICYSVNLAIFKAIDYIKTYKNKSWYIKNKRLFSDEEKGVLIIEPNAERDFEAGKLVYTIITDKHITRQEGTLAYQMVYSKDFTKDNSIRIYFIMPNLEDMFTAENKLASSYIKTDECGEKYLEFTNKEKPVSGEKVIRYLYELVDSYNLQRAGEETSTLKKL